MLKFEHILVFVLIFYLQNLEAEGSLHNRQTFLQADFFGLVCLLQNYSPLMARRGAIVSFIASRYFIVILREKKEAKECMERPSKQFVSSFSFLDNKPV